MKIFLGLLLLGVPIAFFLWIGWLARRGHFKNMAPVNQRRWKMFIYVGTAVVVLLRLRAMLHR